MDPTVGPVAATGKSSSRIGPKRDLGPCHTLRVSDQQPPAVFPGGYPPYQPPPDHPQAITTLVLGILGLVVCGVLAPFAWVMGNRVVHEIDASQGRIGGRGNANVGRILGIVGTALLGVSLVILALVLTLFVFGGVVASTQSG
jgi:hypothetical protein